MAGIERRSFNEPDEVFPSDDGSRTEMVQIGENFVMRSVLQPGWSWEQFVGPMVDDDTCPMEHREVIGQAGDYLEISPGHLAWVIGDEPCVTIDW